MAAVVATMLAAASAVAGDSTPVAAVWKEQHIDFVYFGRTSRYSCEGIRDKLRAILRNLGVRRDVGVVVVPCDDFAGPGPLPDRSPTVHLVFFAPSVPVTDAKPLHPGDLAPLDAQFEGFSITADAFRNMEPGDCELVEDFVRQVMPKLVTRNVSKDITCIPYQLSGSHYWVRGEVLKALPRTAPAGAPKG
ncbi:MAG: hypothetical protein ACHQIL_09970 [Steroidobacterales bacterium]